MKSRGQLESGIMHAESVISKSKPAHQVHVGEGKVFQFIQLWCPERNGAAGKFPRKSSPIQFKLMSLIWIYFTDVDHSGAKIQKTRSKRRRKFARNGTLHLLSPPDVSKQFISN